MGMSNRKSQCCLCGNPVANKKVAETAATPTAAEQRQYKLALAAYMRIEERISHLEAEREIARANMTRAGCYSDKERERYEPRALWHVNNAASCLVSAQAPRELAERAEAEAAALRGAMGA